MKPFLIHFILLPIWALLFGWFIFKAYELIGIGLTESTQLRQKILFNIMAIIVIPFLLPLILAALINLINNIYPILNLSNYWDDLTIPIILGIIFVTSFILLFNYNENIQKTAVRTFSMPVLFLLGALIKHFFL